MTLTSPQFLFFGSILSRLPTTAFYSCLSLRASHIVSSSVVFARLPSSVHNIEYDGEHRYRRHQRGNGQKTSDKYNPARLLSVIPSHFMEEHALLLSSLGRHEEVLNIYVRQVSRAECTRGDGGTFC